MGSCWREGLVPIDYHDYHDNDYYHDYHDNDYDELVWEIYQEFGGQYVCIM